MRRWTLFVVAMLVLGACSKKSEQASDGKKESPLVDMVNKTAAADSGGKLKLHFLADKPISIEL